MCVSAYELGVLTPWSCFSSGEARTSSTSDRHAAETGRAPHHGRAAEEESGHGWHVRVARRDPSGVARSGRALAEAGSALPFAPGEANGSHPAFAGLHSESELEEEADSALSLAPFASSWNARAHGLAHAPERAADSLGSALAEGARGSAACSHAPCRAFWGSSFGRRTPARDRNTPCCPGTAHRLEEAAGSCCGHPREEGARRESGRARAHDQALSSCCGCGCTPARAEGRLCQRLRPGERRGGWHRKGS